MATQLIVLSSDNKASVTVHDDFGKAAAEANTIAGKWHEEGFRQVSDRAFFAGKHWRRVYLIDEHGLEWNVTPSCYLQASIPMES